MNGEDVLVTYCRVKKNWACEKKSVKKSSVKFSDVKPDAASVA